MRRYAWFLLFATCLVPGCGGGGGGSGPSPSTGRVTGTVTSASSGVALGGAIVTAGAATATSDASGRFELTGVGTGSAVEIQCARPGFLAYSATIAVQEGSNSHDIALAVQEVYSSGIFSVYVPASAAQVRGVLVALGGPDTRAFASGQSTGVDNPVLEASLQALGEQLRALARDSGLAVLGNGRAGWQNTSADDAIILSALQTAADASGRPELSSAPLILFGISGGGQGAFGLMQRQTARAAAFVLLVTQGLGSFLSTASQQVPGYISLAELDDRVNNPLSTQDYLNNRAAGAIWALAVEPGKGHSDLSVEARTALVNWMTVAAGLRLPATPGDALRTVDESSGWLGNRSTFEVAPYDSYVGDKSQASWLPTAATAAEWRAFVSP